MNTTVEKINLPIDQIEKNEGQIEGLPVNPRQWTRKELTSLKNSLEETPELFEARGLIVIKHEEKYIIMGGNMRYEAAKELKLETVPCFVLPEDTPIQKLKEIVIKDNGSFGEWDFDELANNWSDLNLCEWGVPAWETEPEQEAQKIVEDNFDEEKEVPSRAQRGNIFQLGHHRLMCGDSTNPEDVANLMAGDMADVVFTDPPYGVSYVGNTSPQGKEWKMIANDDLRGDSLYQFLLHAFQNLAKYLKDDGAFYIWFTTSNHIQFETAINEAGLRVKQELIWDKGMVLGHSDYHWAYEPCLYGTHKDKNCKWYGDRTQKTFLAMNKTEIRDLKKEQLVEILLNLHDGRDCWKIDRVNGAEYIHPTQKPITLAGRGLINSSCAGQIVLDLFGGSGSTMMAAEQLGRKARIMEFDPKYVDKIIARWESYTGETAEQIL